MRVFVGKQEIDEETFLEALHICRQKLALQRLEEQYPPLDPIETDLLRDQVFQGWEQSNG
jgi:hypothetical protein